ncbi:hypothetical protein NEOLEDRAFT_1066929, partial [Neolentinus lepideus HHB14362 ss-1]
CFPHVVNLVCQAVVKAIMSLDYGDDCDCTEGNHRALPSFLDVLDKDRVETLWSLICVVCCSLNKVVQALHKNDLQLLHDVKMRWSSMLLMIERATLLWQAIAEFLHHEDFAELRKFELSGPDWTALEHFMEILHMSDFIYSVTFTPTLGDAIPTFKSLLCRWEAHAHSTSEVASVVQKGIDKLSLYYELTDPDKAPVYALAVCECSNIAMGYDYH